MVKCLMCVPSQDMLDCRVYRRVSGSTRMDVVARDLCRAEIASVWNCLFTKYIHGNLRFEGRERSDLEER